MVRRAQTHKVTHNTHNTQSLTKHTSTLFWCPPKHNNWPTGHSCSAQRLMGACPAMPLATISCSLAFFCLLFFLELNLKISLKILVSACSQLVPRETLVNAESTNTPWWSTEIHHNVLQAASEISMNAYAVQRPQSFRNYQRQYINLISD